MHALRRALVRSASPDIDWDKLGFGLTPTAAMYVATCTRGDEARAPAGCAASLRALKNSAATPAPRRLRSRLRSGRRARCGPTAP